MYPSKKKEIGAPGGAQDQKRKRRYMKKKERGQERGRLTDTDKQPARIPIPSLRVSTYIEDYAKDLQITRRSIPIQVSTRGAGFATAMVYNAAIERLGAARVNETCSIHAMYRIVLQAMAYKINLTSQVACPPMSFHVENSYNYIMDDDITRQALRQCSLHALPVANILAALGVVEVNGKTWVPRMHSLRPPLADAPHDATHLHPRIMRRVVLALSSTETPVHYREAFFKINPIPGAVWVQDNAGDSGHLLANPDDIWPEVLDPIADSTAYIKFVALEPAAKSAHVPWTGYGTPASLVGSSLARAKVNCEIRARTDADAVVNYDVQGKKLPPATHPIDLVVKASIAGRLYDKLWSICATTGIDKSYFTLGACCFLGENSEFPSQSYECGGAEFYTDPMHVMMYKLLYLR